ncbi:MAG: hypothetical protein CVU12_08625 [Bacteroidetes bacterium HGW-Bacteroidetes-7]|jgi:hypothetical protein|nr:MAG: hypothetical protein CVU12_08625 [Bacteroidetes bacterium HGW-Bacteroidetes-7]
MLGKIKTTKELALYLGTSYEKLNKIDPEKSFASFYINKHGSTEKRLIEYPRGELFRILDRLSDGLQWLYLDHLTTAAYGFIRKLKPNKDPRNIYTNAKRHLGKKYLLNIDLDDFFHQVDTRKLQNLFSDYSLFSLNQESEQLLVKLVSYRGRLPMGSPTSPSLSNFATIGIDNDLSVWAGRNSFDYTRYVDDMSFSSNIKITQNHINQIIEILFAHRFLIDPNKTKIFGPQDTKEVTGLVLGKTITVPDEFINAFMKDINRFSEMHHLACQNPDSRVFEWLEKMRKVLQGRMAFLKMVHGPKNETYKLFQLKLDNIYKPELLETSVSWRYAGYEYS